MPGLSNVAHSFRSKTYVARVTLTTTTLTLLLTNWDINFVSLIFFNQHFTVHNNGKRLFGIFRVMDDV